MTIATTNQVNCLVEQHSEQSDVWDPTFWLAHSSAFSSFFFDGDDVKISTPINIRKIEPYKGEL